MGKKQDQVFNQLIASITAQQNQTPWAAKTNPAQDRLTDQALAANDWLQKGEYGQLPKGMFFDYQMPAQALEQYKKYANVNQGGTFALANNDNGGGRGAATAMQGQYLQDRFARDAAQNYQNNIANTGSRIENSLNQSSGANLNSQQLDLQGRSVNNQNSMGTISALNGVMNGAYLNKPSIWASILGAGAQLGSAAIEAKWG